MKNKNSILIVDDEKANLLYLNHILSADYVVYMTMDAGKAIERANEYCPDLILLDIIMPGMNGYEVLAALKKSEKTKDIPVIFITGLNSSEDEIKGLNLGAEAYITKPFNDAIVRLRVRNHLKMVNEMRAIERSSMLDQLTNIANRHNFNLQMSSEWRKAVRDQSPVSIMMIDVDKFKIYNDTYGHQQGDAALQTLASVLRQNLKHPDDFAARWGSEEFAVLLPMTDMNDALTTAEAIRVNIEGTAIPCDGTPTNVTVSIGVNAQIPSPNDSIDDFILKANNALHAAKEMGRNRVCKA